MRAEVTIRGSVDLNDDNQAAADERIVAYHEAGHCVAAYRLRIPFTGRKALTIIAHRSLQRVFCTPQHSKEISNGIIPTVVV